MARKKRSKGLRVSLMLTVGLMIVSFAAGMLTQKIVFREPQTDAGLTYIEDIPVMTDFLPEGTRARPGQKREIKYLVIHETDNTGTGANAAAHNSFIHQNANAEEGIVSWHYTVDDHEIYHHLPDDETAYTQATAWRRTAATWAASASKCASTRTAAKSATNGQLINTEKTVCAAADRVRPNPSRH